jgi:hypothetical protein
MVTMLPCMHPTTHRIISTFGISFDDDKIADALKIGTVMDWKHLACSLLFVGPLTLYIISYPNLPFPHLFFRPVSPHVP